MLITTTQISFKNKLNNLGNQDMIVTTQFFNMGDPLGDSWISAYP